MNGTPNFAEEPGFEEWHLTALALGELSPELAASTQRRIDRDPDLARQYAEIQSTLSLVLREWKSTDRSLELDPSRREEVLAHIQRAPASTPLASPSVVTDRHDANTWRRWRFAGLASAALAASVLLLLTWRGMPNLNFQSGTRLAWEPRPSSSDASLARQPSSASNAIADAPVASTDSYSLAAEPSGAGSAVPSNASKSVEKESIATLETRSRMGEVAATPSTGKNGQSAASAAPAIVGDEGRHDMSFRGGMAGGRGLGGGLGGLSGMPKPSLGAGMAQDVVVPAKDSPENEFGASKSMDALSTAPDFSPSAGATAGAERRKVMHDRRELSEEVGLDKDAKVDASKLQLPKELRANVPSLDRRLREQGMQPGDRFDAIPETPFVAVSQQPLSTFSIDVDTASYSKLRQYVLEQHTLPSPDTIRIEEWINYFEYAYPGPKENSPFAAHMRLGSCPWNPEHRLVRVAIAAKKASVAQERPASNLVFLIDVSGSMAEANKLPLVKRTLQLLIPQLREQDRVAIVVYAGAAGCVLPSTSGANKEALLASINELQSGGSTNGGQGIQLAYNIAKEHFVPGGINRVILCTDGDFNVGVTGTDALVAMMRENAQSNVFLTCLGYGIGNYNDSMMEQISNRGNGNYAMIDSELEAKRVMVEQVSGTLMTVAKDVKLQIEFNPARVASYRLIGYENRRLATQDFNDDRKDAGEIGAGHCVTALYEVVPAGAASSAGGEPELRYAKRRDADSAKPSSSEAADEHAREWLYLKIRSKQPEASESALQTFTLSDTLEESYTGDASDMDWASSVAEFGMLLRHSQLAPGADWDRMLSRAMGSALSDPYRRECLLIMQQARRLVGR